jgi:hypothetical protein
MALFVAALHMWLIAQQAQIPINYTAIDGFISIRLKAHLMALQIVCHQVHVFQLQVTSVNTCNIFLHLATPPTLFGLYGSASPRCVSAFLACRPQQEAKPVRGSSPPTQKMRFA